VTLHEMTAGVDDGDIILQDNSLEIRPGDTYEELFERQAQLAKNILKQFFTEPRAYLAAKRPQDHSKATLAPRLPFGISGADTVAQIRLKK
jgi:methionyl-tRNA formyltransferase